MRSSYSDTDFIDLKQDNTGVWRPSPKPLFSPRTRLAIFAGASWLCYIFGVCILAIWSFGGDTISTPVCVLTGFPLVVASHLIEAFKYPQR